MDNFQGSDGYPAPAPAPALFGTPGPGPGIGVMHPAPSPAPSWHTRPRPRPRHLKVPGPGVFTVAKNQKNFPKNAKFFRFLVLRANYQQRFFVGDLHRAISNWKFFGLRLEANPKFLRGQFFYCNNRILDAIFAQKRSKNILARCSAKHQIFWKDLENVDQKSTIFSLSLFRLFSRIWIWNWKNNFWLLSRTALVFKFEESMRHTMLKTSIYM